MAASTQSSLKEQTVLPGTKFKVSHSFSRLSEPTSIARPFCQHRPLLIMMVEAFPSATARAFSELICILLV